MAIKAELHKFVVNVTTAKNGDGIALGFTSLADAISFVANQVPDEDKQINYITEALTEGTEIDGVNYQIYDINSFLDIFSSDED